VDFSGVFSRVFLRVGGSEGRWEDRQGGEPQTRLRNQIPLGEKTLQRVFQPCCPCQHFQSRSVCSFLL
jgi:hypothetical protein